MPLWFKTPSRVTPTRLDVQEKAVSLIVSLVAAALMLSGFGAVLAEGAAWSMPGNPATPLTRLLFQQSMGWSLMSLGIILLGVLPLLRVALAAKAYADAGTWGDFLIALAVLAELVLSTMWRG